MEKETAFVAIPQRGKRKKEAQLDKIKIRFLNSRKELPCMSLSRAKFNILGDYLWLPLQSRQTGNVPSSFEKIEKRSSGLKASSALQTGSLREENPFPKN